MSLPKGGNGKWSFLTLSLLTLCVTSLGPAAICMQSIEINNSFHERWDEEKLLGWDVFRHVQETPRGQFEGLPQRPGEHLG